jgi:hypothetical protein
VGNMDWGGPQAWPLWWPLEEPREPEEPEAPREDGTDGDDGESPERPLGRSGLLAILEQILRSSPTATPYKWHRP